MQAVRYHGREDVRLDDVEEPATGPGEVKLRVLYNGLCGSDVAEFFDGSSMVSETPHPLTGATLPYIIGHELSGEVVEIGSGAENIEVGDLVAVEPIETCGTCARCKQGYRHLCRLIAFHGYTRAGGGLAERTVVRRDMVHRMPPGLTGMHGALAEPMAVARRAARRTGALAGELVAVYGAGPIGLGVLLAFHAAGVDTVISDPSPTRRAAAARLGATHVVDPGVDEVDRAVRDLTGGLGAAGAVDAAGAEAAAQSAMRSTRPDGTIVVVAHHHDPIQVRSGRLIFSEIHLTGSAIYDRDDFGSVLDAMAAGHYPIDGWVDTIALEDVEDGLRRLRSQEANKLLVDVAGSGV